MRILLFSFLWLFILASCRQMIDAVNMKQLSPAVVTAGLRSDSWYEYMPEFAPYFCLKTRCHLIYTDEEAQLGYWRALHPLPPHRVLMEARGHSLILHRSFVWDGMSFGNTEPSALLPSLLHDALYFARQGDAPVSRREVDLIFLRACRKYGCSGKYSAYFGIRSFGGLFGKPPGVLPLIIQHISPDVPPAPLVP